MLQQHFQQHVQQHFSYLQAPGTKLLLAVSGGVDSVVLADLIYHCNMCFAVAHCNFQLRAEESQRDEKFVEALACRYNSEFFSTRFNTEQFGAEQNITIQEAARSLRYNWFKELIDAGKAQYLLTAHHADDNIETAIMNFFRGTGLQGLCGIQPKQFYIIRPLLIYKKNELIDYAQQQQLEFVSDSSNNSDKYTRNFFRNKIIPLAKEKYAAADDNILRNIERLNEANILYQSALSAITKGLLYKEKNAWKVPILKLKKTKPLPTIVWELFKQFDVQATQVNEIIKLLDADNSSYINNEKYTFFKDRKWIIITANADKIISECIIIDSLNKSIQYPSGQLIFSLNNKTDFKINADTNIASLDAAKIELPLLLRPWKQGDYFYPLGMDKKKKLSRFFIDKKLSATEKNNVWVIEMNKKIIWVVNQRIDNRFKVTEATRELLVIQHHKS